LDDQEGLRHDAYAVKIRCIHKKKKNKTKTKTKKQEEEEVCPSLLPELLQ
jgi:hypothetical protein